MEKKSVLNQVFCEDGKKTFSSIKNGEFLQYQSDHACNEGLCCVEFTFVDTYPNRKYEHAVV
jgi:hypothetical protein